MIWKNLLRRKGRTFLTIIGIAVGVAAIIGLGAMANGIDAGYNSMLTGSKSDLVLSQPDAFDLSLSAVDQSVEPQLRAMSEVQDVSGMLEGFVQAESLPFVFVFGYPDDSFVLNRFQIIDGTELASREAQRARGIPILLGKVSSESLKKTVGDSIRLSGYTYRVVGIYETGDTFEDSGVVMRLADAQIALGKPRQVSVYYIQLKNPALRERLESRAARLWPDLALTGTDDFANRQMMGDMMNGFVWAIAGLAIVIGGVGMMNAQLMAVMERTREIGVLRAVGWSSWRVLGVIFGESLLVSILGGILGIAIGYGFLQGFSEYTSMFGGSTTTVSLALIQQAAIVVFILGVLGGLYPAWRASQLEPVEALRYEGGSSGQNIRRFPIGGMAVQSLWQRTSRTALTLGAIGLTVGAILSLDGIVKGTMGLMENMLTGGGDAQIVIRQADIADTSLSALDERIGEKIATLPEVETVSGLIFTAVTLQETPFFVVLGYAPNEYAIRRFVPVEGERITSNHQIMLGRMMASTLNKKVGDTLDLGGSRFRIVGIYETGGGFEELGGIVSMRDGQIMAGRPRKVTMYSITLHEPRQAEMMVENINATFPEAHAALAGEFVEQMPDMQNMDAMIIGISFLAITVGGVGVMNTMLMAVLERTREIGVLRALGWRRRQILSMILQEALILGLFGGAMGIVIAFSLTYLITQIPMVGDAVTPVWELNSFIRALVIALSLGLVGGLYPAFRATRLMPVEALRYE